MSDTTSSNIVSTKQEFSKLLQQPSVPVRIVGEEFIKGTSNTILPSLATTAQRLKSVEIQALPGARASTNNNTLSTGLVYVVNGDTKAIELLANREDLCGGLSLYDLDLTNGDSNIDIDWLMNENSQRFLSKAKVLFDELASPQHKPILTDFSLFEVRSQLNNYVQYLDSSEDSENPSSFITPSNPSDTSLCLEICSAFGSENCSISLLKRLDQETGLVHFHLAIRNYDPIASYRFQKWLALNPMFTVAQLYESDWYQTLLTNGNDIRDHIAAKIGALLGCNFANGVHQGKLFGMKVPLIKPNLEQHYNVFEKVSMDIIRYAFYDGCFSIGEKKATSVLFGLGRDHGYQMYSVPETQTSTEPIRFGLPKFSHAFPLGVPSSSSSFDTTTQQQQQQQKKGSNGRVTWAGNFDIHLKMSPLFNNNKFSNRDFIKSEKNLIHQLLGAASTPLEERRLLTQECYISSPMEDRMNIHQLVQCRKKNIVSIRVPLHSKFVKELFMKCYLQYRLNFRNGLLDQNNNNNNNNTLGPLKHIQDVILDDDANFMYFHAQHLEAMISYIL